MNSQLIVSVVLVLAVLASPALAVSGCGKWVIRDNTDYLKDPMFEEAVASSTGSNATANAGGLIAVKNETKEEGQKESTNKAAAAVSRTPPINLAGKWKVMLEMNSTAGLTRDDAKTIDLILIQTGERLQGYGTLLEEGRGVPATATGSISERIISLDIKLTAQKKDYRLDLALHSNRLEGSYELFKMEELAEKGNASARMSDF